MDTVSAINVVIKNADGITPDFILECVPLNATRIRTLKSMLRQRYEGNPEEASMKFVFSGRLIKDDELLAVVIQLHDHSTPPVFHLLLRKSSSAAQNSADVGANVASVVERADFLQAASSAQPPVRTDSFSSTSSATLQNSLPVTPPLPPALPSPSAFSAASPWTAIADPSAAQYAALWPPSAAAVPPAADWRGAGAAAVALCYEQLHRVYYETYCQAYMAALTAETQAQSSASSHSATAAPALEASSAVSNTATPLRDASALAEAEIDRPVVEGAAAIEGDGVANVHLLAGARGPHLMRERGAAAEGGAGEALGNGGVDNRNAGQRRLNEALRLAVKLVFVVLLFGQDSPRERMLLLCCIAFTIFVHQMGLLWVPAWLAPRPPPPPRHGGLEPGEGDNDAGGDAAAAAEGPGLGVDLGMMAGDGTAGAGAEDRGFLGDVAVLVVAFFTSLLPSNAPNEAPRPPRRVPAN